MIRPPSALKDPYSNLWAIQEFCGFEVAVCLVVSVYG